MNTDDRRLRRWARLRCAFEFIDTSIEPLHEIVMPARTGTVEPIKYVPRRLSMAALDLADGARASASRRRSGALALAGHAIVCSPMPGYASKEYGALRSVSEEESTGNVKYITHGSTKCRRCNPTAYGGLSVHSWNTATRWGYRHHSLVNTYGPRKSLRSRDGTSEAARNRHGKTVRILGLLVLRRGGTRSEREMTHNWL